ncbi:lasso peptide biosynthesis B2 protein [Priestia flexa]|jgi:Transglutaminase-like superfamily|uniref:Stage V sporulation protein S n=2 Tax=Priestia TaxID=2800373 RepID=A0A0V8JPR9_9BACI|nr:MULTISPECIES: lasso peptide biosynthesis B2 protein [Priestia]AQX55018.1 stage V sporulation protein S [Priestia flexa]KSU89054.1 stage V sporulation protein S [Priestia veravalensis]MBN8251472.1 lasso peptide biosynthesis B2 protein [Priestia flexa]MBN8434264.1 lasso peptide biosynthesis B2 protein [Priestia flexa]MCA0966952.1 lasso peptide biosynthesis B2 protein [Priestia flexa]
MKIWSRCRRFIELERQKKRLFIEAFVYLAWARLMKEKSFEKVASSLHLQMNETSFETEAAHKQTLQNVSDALYAMSGYTFWESQCLVKALAGMKMLEKRNIESTLYLGTAKDEDHQLVAHAWLRSGSFYVSGVEGKERYTVIAKFAKHPTKRRTG